MRVVGIEGSPPAAPALHADDPLGGPIDRNPITRRAEAIEGESYRGRVVEIGVVGVLELERPPTGAQTRAGHRPITGHLEHLLCLEPVERSSYRRFEARVFDLHQCVAGERRIPDRRKAGLAVAALAI